MKTTRMSSLLFGIAVRTSSTGYAQMRSRKDTPSREHCRSWHLLSRMYWRCMRWSRIPVVLIWQRSLRVAHSRCIKSKFYLRLDLHAREFSHLSFNLRDGLANHACAHSLIKPRGIWIGRDLNFVYVQPAGLIHCVQEKLFADTGADV